MSAVQFQEAKLQVPATRERGEERPPLHSPHAVRYGWLPPAMLAKTDTGFRPGINLGTEGMERCGYTFLDAGTLLAFTDIEYSRRHKDDRGTSIIPGSTQIGGSPTLLEWIPKTAAEIEDDLKTSEYATEWGLVFFDELTGMEDVAEAFRIFTTVQPYVFDLSTLEAELYGPATERISEAGFKGTIEVPFYATGKDGKPLTIKHRKVHLSEVAESVRERMVAGLGVALRKRDEVLGTTERIMGERSGTGVGKVQPDSLDRHLYQQSHIRIPSMVRAPETSQAQSDPEIRELLKRMAERDLERESDALRVAEEARAAAAELKRQVEELTKGQSG